MCVYMVGKASLIILKERTGTLQSVNIICYQSFFRDELTMFYGLIFFILKVEKFHLSVHQY